MYVLCVYVFVLNVVCDGEDEDDGFMFCLMCVWMWCVNVLVCVLKCGFDSVLVKGKKEIFIRVE